MTINTTFEHMSERVLQVPDDRSTEYPPCSCRIYSRSTVELAKVHVAEAHIAEEVGINGVLPESW